LTVILFGLVVLAPSFFIKGSFTLTAEASVFVPAGQSLGEKNPFLGQDSSKPLEPPDFSLIQGNSLMGFSIPLTVSPSVLGSLTGDAYSGRENEITEYTVQSGDTLTGVTEKFDISLETLLWANNLTKGSVLKVGQDLIILPVSGLLHHVTSGETVGGIAQKYKGDINEIIVFNELSNEGDINVGDILIIPDGVMPSTTKVYTPSLAPLATSYFICPISLPCWITQGLHWYNAIDFSHGKCGESIYAAAGGQILKIKYGWNGGAGNYLEILHPNGVITMYGHLQSVLVSIGQQVSQGQIVAFMGGQPGTAGVGRSTGCHLHFQVIGAKNPFAR